MSFSHTYTVEPHPTCKGKLLAVHPKPESWHCLTDTEAAFYAIGGTYWRPIGQPGAVGVVCYTLSPAQARDVDLILRAGYLSSVNNRDWIVEEADPLFWHPDRPDEELTRAEVLALISPPPRCRRTADLFA